MLDSTMRLGQSYYRDALGVITALVTVITLGQSNAIGQIEVVQVARNQHWPEDFSVQFSDFPIELSQRRQVFSISFVNHSTCLVQIAPLGVFVERS